MTYVCLSLPLGPKIDLGNPCSAGEVCKDKNAACIDGACKCTKNSFEVTSNKTCGK